MEINEDQIMPRHKTQHRDSTSSETTTTTTASDDINSCTSNEDDLNEEYLVLSKQQNNKKLSKKSLRLKNKRIIKQKQPQQQQQSQQHQHNQQQQQRPQQQQSQPLTTNRNNKQQRNKQNYQPQKEEIIAEIIKVDNKVTKNTKITTTNDAMEIDEETKENNPTVQILPTSSPQQQYQQQQQQQQQYHHQSQQQYQLNKYQKQQQQQQHNYHHNENYNNKKSPSNVSVKSTNLFVTSSTTTTSINKTTTKTTTTTNFRQYVVQQLQQQQEQEYVQLSSSLELSESELNFELRRYVVDGNLLRAYGYPVDSAIHEGCVEILKCLPRKHTTLNTVNDSIINNNDGLTTKLDNKSDCSNSDSGQGSSDTSPAAIDSDSSDVVEDMPLFTSNTFQHYTNYEQSLQKQCVRCESTFLISPNGEYLNRKECFYHWGKLIHIYNAGSGVRHVYSCCHGPENSVGCTSNPLHVWTGAVVGLNGPYTDFVRTKPSKPGSPKKVYALDCEMSFTGNGLDVTKISVVGYDGNIVYEHFVLPTAEIADYNTRFSGVTADDLCPQKNKNLKTLIEVQKDLLKLFDADTILIGHALENDLRALRLLHKLIVDTSIVYPHSSGFPYRRALKHLTKIVLRREIQNSANGHSSHEDALACLHLMLAKLQRDNYCVDL